MGKKYITPEGTRDLVLGECNIKKNLQIKIESILDKWGYNEVVTPTIEFYETFNSGFQNLGKRRFISSLIIRVGYLF